MSKFCSFLFVLIMSCQDKPILTTEKADFIAGQDSLYRFFNQNIKNPYGAIDIEGTVWLSCTVETDGQITDVAVRRGVGGGWNEEAIRLVRLTSGNWQPTVKNGILQRDTVIIGVPCKIQ